VPITTDIICRNNPLDNDVSQLNLSLYLTTQCLVKLDYPVTSLANTLDCVEVKRRHLDVEYTLERLLLKLTERKILLYIQWRVSIIN